MGVKKLWSEGAAPPIKNMRVPAKNFHYIIDTLKQVIYAIIEY